MPSLRIAAALTLLLATSETLAESPSDLCYIGSRREVFVDRYLIDRLDGLRLELGRPTPAGIALKYDKPWEGIFTFFTTVIKDGKTFRMYYRSESPGSAFSPICYAESEDGIHWRKPELGLVDIAGSKANNAVMNHPRCFSPFLDTHPACPPEERFKANAEVGKGLAGYVSADGIHWKGMGESILVPRALNNNFDSQNVMFWSQAEQKYVCYSRHMEGKHRAHSRATSADFRTWTPQTLMTYSDTGSTVPSHHYYTVQIEPYFRAPHVYVSLPGRFLYLRRALTPDEGKALEVHPGGGGTGDVSDGVLLTSRAGSERFDVTFPEAFIRPGPGKENWVSRTNFPACGVVQTGPDEMSLYVQRDYGQKTAHLERMTLRLDGFASVHAPYAGGEMLTRPLRFEGKELEINCSTSAAGGIRIEIQDADGKPIKGYALDDSVEIIADDVARVVTWKKAGSSVEALSGKTVRLRVAMKDADLYSLRFR